MEIPADVAIVGAGPAGATAALMLAPSVRTVLVDRLDPQAEPDDAIRIGESLPAAARRLLRDMGVWDDFLLQAHVPCYARRSVWGGAAAMSTDSIADPDGPGWHLDRTRFDAWLRAWACPTG